MDRQTDKETDRQVDGQTDERMDRQRETETDKHTNSDIESERETESKRRLRETETNLEEEKKKKEIEIQRKLGAKNRDSNARDIENIRIGDRQATRQPAIDRDRSSDFDTRYSSTWNTKQHITGTTTTTTTAMTLLSGSVHMTLCYGDFITR